MNRIKASNALEDPLERKVLVHKRRLFFWIVVALVAVIAVTLYEKTLKFPELVYSVYPSKTAIYKNGEPSRLTVLIDSQKVQGDVSSIKIGFWNRGSKAVEAADVLTGVKIRIDTGHPIYVARIVRVVNDASGLKLDLSNQAAGIIGLSWNKLEKGDGGIVQLIYGGSPDLSPSVEGAIDGQREIKKIETRSFWPLSTRQIVPAGFNWRILLEIVLLLAVFFLFVVYFIYATLQMAKIRFEPEFKITVIVEVFTLMMFLASVWLVIYFVLQSHSIPNAPMDF